MKQQSYEDFELEIERRGKSYKVKVRCSLAGDASTTFTWPFDEKELELWLLKMGNTRAKTRGIHNPQEKAASELGGKLFDAVFKNTVGKCLTTSLAKARDKGMGLRLRLSLQEVPELANLPWEFLYDRSADRFLAQSNWTPIVRYVGLQESVPALEVNFPLQMLVMISVPAGVDRLNVKQEKSLVQKALKSLQDAGLIHIDWLENSTLSDLHDQLNKKDYHIFHYIGHGGFDERTNEGVLILQDRQGRSTEVDAHRIATLLHVQRTLRLVVLNSCEGARNSITDPFAGVATHIIRQGIPAVIAMQFDITDDAAITFARKFYSSLVAGFPIDAAVSEARLGIFVDPGITGVEWGTPVLYMRSEDSFLFQLHEIAEAQKLRTELLEETTESLSDKDDSPTELPAQEAKAPPTPIAPEPTITHNFAKPDNGVVIYNGHTIEVVNSVGLAIGAEIVKYDGKEVSRKWSAGGSDHIFRVFEDGEHIQYVVHFSASPFGCEISRNGRVIFSNLSALSKQAVLSEKSNGDIKHGFGQRGTITYNGHKIEVNDTGWGIEIVKYDGAKVSQKASIIGGDHIFRIIEDGVEAQYVVRLSRGSSGCEISRNGEIIYSNL